MQILRTETKIWLAAGLGEDNPQPIFRDRAVDMPVTAKPSLPPEIGATIGKACGRRILPYRLQDRYDRDRKLREFKSIVLENEHLKAVFLPELGGRLISLVQKETGRELLYHNPVFQPANLALRDAWFAGGIEWNIGHFGHSYHTCAPIFASEIAGVDGSQGLRLYDYERCKGLLWQIDFHLPSGAEFLYAYTRVVNPLSETVPMYWWTNVAVTETPDLRVLAPASKSIFVEYGQNGSLAYGQADLPGLPTVEGADGTYSKNLTFTNEFFYQCQGADMPWEAALDGSGTGFVEASTAPLNVRKLFCWGMHQGGQRWKEFLSEPGQGYIEIQAGLAPTQQHTINMPGHTEWLWMQAFGAVSANPEKVHGKDWDTAWRTVDAELKRKLTMASLNGMKERCHPLALSQPLRNIIAGSGWGALESKRRLAQGESAFPIAFAFPETSMGMDQARWTTLLETGIFLGQDLALPPGEWMIQPEWRALLERSLDQAPSAFGWLHLGVMRMEAFDELGAQFAWEMSLQLEPSAWAYRNLGVLAHRRGEIQEAISFYSRAWALAVAPGNIDHSFIIEYLTILFDAREFEAARQFFRSLPVELQSLGAVRIMAAKVSLELNDLEFVEATLNTEFASIREGARDLTDLWFGLSAKRLAIQSGHPVDAEMLKSVKTHCPPPSRIDFRVTPS